MRYTIVKENASITIYLSLVLCLIISILFSITELSRMRLNRLYLQVATNASIDSMLSLYDKKLWEYYRIFGVCYKDKDLLKKEYEQYLLPYVYDDESKEYISNWFISKYNADSSKLDISSLVDDTNFENESIDYMKMILPGKLISMFNKNIDINKVDSITDIYDEVLSQKDEYEKDRIYEDVDKRYFDFNDEISNLERYSKIINDNVASLNGFIRTNRYMSISKNKITATRIIAIVSQINTYVNTININIIKFRELMDVFRDKVIQSENNFESDLSTGLYNYNDITIDFIRDEYKRFEEYVDEDNEMNTKANQLSEEISERIFVLIEYENRFREYLSEIESLESQKRALSTSRYEGRAEDIRAINDEIREINEEIYEEGHAFRDELASLEFTEPNLLVSESARQDLINALKTLLNSTEDFILKMVMPEEKYERLNDADISMNEYNIQSSNNLINKVLMGEYFFDMFNYYGKEELNELTPSNSHNLEVERLLFGKSSDKDNLKSTIYRILLIREGLNLMYIYKDSNKRELARHFVYATFGVLSPVVAEIIYILVLSCWAFAQAIMDVKNLLDNKKVLFFHTDESFQFDLEDIFSLITGTITNTSSEYIVKDKDLALNYKDYLRLLLIIENDNALNSRAVSIIQHNMSKEQDYFDISKTIYSFNVENEFESSNIFTKMTFINSNEILKDNYRIKVNAYASY